MNALEKNVPVATAETLLSETIAWLRFPLIVLVVFIHVSYGLPETQKITDFPVANMICENFVQAGIASVAVPLFFLVSGFLYFYKTDWSVKAYGKKSCSRVKSLLVPFVVWSVFAVAYSILTYQLGLTRSALCADNHSLLDWLADIYGTTYGADSKLAFPLVFQFWFLRDLFIVGLFSPLWHALLKRRIAGEIFLCALGATWFFYRGLQFPGFSTTAVFFFCAGAYFAIRRRDFVADFSVAGVPVFALYLPVLAADALTKDFSWNWIPHRAFICISVVAVVALVARGISAGKLREMRFLSEASFFVYAMHGMAFFKSPYSKALEHFYTPSTNTELVVVFFVRAAFEIAVCLGVYRILRRAFPWSLRFLTGGR